MTTDNQEYIEEPFTGSQPSQAVYTAVLLLVKWLFENAIHPTINIVDSNHNLTEDKSANTKGV